MKFTIGVFFAGLLIASAAQAFDLVKDGKPVATIVLPDTAHESEVKAAQVLTNYIRQASGAEIKIVKESEKPAGAIISVGATRMANDAGVTVKDIQSDGYRLTIKQWLEWLGVRFFGTAPASLQYDGYRLTVKQGVLYVLGRDTPRLPKQRVDMGAQGTWRAALGLLEKFGFRWVLPTPMGVRVPQLSTISVPDDLDLTYNPLFIYAIGRMTGLGDWSMANGFRSSVMIYTEGGHTWCTFVSSNLWETHPEYFQMRGGKRVKPEGNGYFLCPSNPDVQKLLADGLRAKFDAGFDLVQLGQSDGYRPCECEVCKALDEPGEIQEQVHVPHYNVIKMVFQTHPKKLVHMLIYPPTNKPSKKVKEYPPNVLPEVCLTWTTAQAFAGKDDFDRAKLVRGHEEALKFWSSKMPGGLTVYVYYFGLYHAVGYAPKKSPRMIAEEIRLLIKNNVKGIYFCGAGENWGAEGPSYYVAGRIMIDPKADVDALVDEYCECAFGKAGKTMRKYYDLLFSCVEAAPFSSKSDREAFLATYSSGTLDKLEAMLNQARAEAAGDQRALGWLRLADISFRQFALITRTYRLYDSYLDDPTPESFEKIRAVVLAYRAMCDEVLNMNKNEPAFVRDFFPYWGTWGKVKDNGGMGGANLKVPFAWDFDDYAKTKSLPGGTLNGGFESTNIERTQPRDWHIHPQVGPDKIFLDTQTKHSGESSLYINLNSDDGKSKSHVFYQHVPRRYKAGKSFTYSCWVKTKDLKGSAYVAVMRYPVIESDPKRLISSEKILKGTNDWTLLSVTFPVREGMVETSVRCHVDGASGEVWFDDANFEEAAAKPAEAGK